MEIRIFQKGFNYSQDGPGNRLVYHMQGCNMQCLWCSNPEGMEIKSEQAQVYGEEDLVSEIIRSKRMFFDGGGVTFTGGEATCQFDVLYSILKTLNEMKINTCIETNATHHSLKQLLPYIDYFIMDFKHYDSDKHKRYTGISNAVIKENIRMLSEEPKEVLVRTPLIHGFNDGMEDASGFSDFWKSINTSRMKFEFLTYHEFGKEKWKELNLDYRMNDGFVPDMRKEYFESEYKKIGLEITST